MNKLLFLLAFSIALAIPGISQDSTFEAYTGKYNFPEGSAVPYVDVKLNNGVLTSESPAGTATLQRMEGDIFSIVEYNGVAEFKRNAEGKITTVKVSVMGLEMEGSKENPAFKYLKWLPVSPVRMLQ
jgi:hypothetical protein